VHPDPDQTIRQRPPAAPRPRPWLAGIVALVLLGIAAGAWFAWPTAPATRRAVALATATPASPLLEEAAIAAFLPEQPVMVRLRENPLVFVLLFPDLEAQADALNRVAALVEKAALPRDRVVTSTELSAAIERTGDDPATWYLGHDYRGADVARFFRLTTAADLPMTAGERWLQARLLEAQAQAGVGSDIALISVANPDHRFDAEARATILRHEIGHGHFFTRPAFAAHVRQVWAERFDPAARAAFERFLEREGYDTANTELMANEAMAFLLFTPDRRLFAPRHVGLSAAELDRLRALLRDGLPPL